MQPSNDTMPSGFSAAERRSFLKTKVCVLLLAIVVMTGLDQWTKHWAQNDLQHRPAGRMTLVDDYAAFSYVRNPGAAWGFMARAPHSFRHPFFLSVSLIAMSVILFLFIRLEPGQTLLLWAISLVMAGAIGNFVDRLHLGYVIDFIELHWRHRYKWPTFNVADIAITIGVGLLFIEMFLKPRAQKTKLPPNEDFSSTADPSSATQKNTSLSSHPEEP